ncbi:hypothetical protein ACQKP0_00065 [Heyndrickxia sp. NPDC080065]|uniref:hypothetical protein n=1 Tax=Heyndrickxia sp. NPDC080065 TaxID=3390568 RepID=UPI003D0232B2
MNNPRNPVESILGVDVRTKQRININSQMENLDKYFLNPIIHKQIHGDEVYVPLSLSRIWSNQ